MISRPCARSLTCSKDSLFPSIAVDEWADLIIASRRRETSHFGMKGEFSTSSLAAAIRVRSPTILSVYRKLGLNIYTPFHFTDNIFYNAPLNALPNINLRCLTPQIL